MGLTAAEAAQNEGPLILTVGWILVAIPGLLVGLRLYSKAVLTQGFGWDDAVCAFSWVLQLIYTSLVTKGVQIGAIGRHVEAIGSQADVSQGLKLVYIGFVIITFSCVFAKSSFVITLLRIVIKPWHRVSLWFILITMNVLMWLCGICYLVQCNPAAALWNTELLAEAQCWPNYAFETIAMIAGAYSGCVDFILAIFPWLIVWKLQMKKREKFGVIVAMSMGLFFSSAAVAAFIKTSKLKNVAAVTDFTYHCSPILLWASAETGLTIFASSIPALRILFVRMRSTTEATNSRRNFYASGKNRSAVRSVNRDEPDCRASPYWSDLYDIADDAISLSERKDDSSDKSILSLSGIKQTREVTITYETPKVKSLAGRLNVTRGKKGAA